MAQKKIQLPLTKSSPSQKKSKPTAFSKTKPRRSSNSNDGGKFGSWGSSVGFRGKETGVRDSRSEVRKRDERATPKSGPRKKITLSPTSESIGRTFRPSAGKSEPIRRPRAGFKSTVARASRPKSY